MHALSFHAGPRALARLRSHGLQAHDVAVIPAAAGGPKGLIFQALDQWLFGTWLAQSPRQRDLIGSSIGAWRMAAACHADPAAAFARLGDLYCAQRYNAKPDQAEIDRVCQQLLADFVGGHEDEVVQHPRHRLHLLTNRGLRGLHAPAHRRAEVLGFAAASLLNLSARERLAHMLERVVVSAGGAAPHWLVPSFDSFTTRVTTLTSANLGTALLASGTLPLIMQPVRAIADAPSGTYWDGGIIDYHLALPYARMGDGELVLYPHFSEHIVPGWLDKAMPWRRAARGAQRHWFDNVIIAAPTPQFLAALPRGRLPDRKDFAYYGLDHDTRIRHWQQAIGEGQRLRDDLMELVARPDLGRIMAL